MNFYEGNSISYDIEEYVNEGTSWRDGKITLHHGGGEIDNIKTDAGKEYYFMYSGNLVSAVEPDKEGICVFYIGAIGNDDPDAWEVAETVVVDFSYNPGGEEVPCRISIRNLGTEAIYDWQVKFDFTGNLADNDLSERLVINEPPLYMIRGDSSTGSFILPGVDRWVAFWGTEEDSVSDITVYTFKDKGVTVGEWIDAESDYNYDYD